jgi:chemotaxis-related protein WspD
MTTSDLKPGAALALTDCWNRIGVSGDQSCEKLAVHVHCRNCEVYAGAAQRNLQRPVSEGYREQWAAHFRLARQSDARDDSAALVFRIGREWLALPATLIDCVAPDSTPHRVPHRGGAGLLGVVNVAGKLLPSIALGSMLGIDQADGAAASGRHTFARLVVLQWEDQTYALPVAELHGIVRYAAGAVATPATTINKGLVRFLTGVLSEADMHIGILDAPLIGHQMARLLR